LQAEHIRASLETSLSLHASGLDAFDVLQFHVWSDEWVGRGDWLETIQSLKEQGKIRFFGVSINDHQPGNAVELIRTGQVDTVQVIYNVFDQPPPPEEELLPAAIMCRGRGWSAPPTPPGWAGKAASTAGRRAAGVGSPPCTV
jgi:aryl-alcohol dehydrogenase-like predicted oxidoreductase